MDKQIQEKIMQLQYLEQSHQQILLQKQTIQQQLMEIESALEELNKKPKQTFKVIGGIMVEAAGGELQKDLNSKKEIAELKIKSIEKQEEKIKKETKKIQEELLSNMKKNE